MQHCPHCAAPLDSPVLFCPHCGCDVEPVRPLPPEAAASDSPITAGAPASVQQVTERCSDVEATGAEVTANPSPRRLSGRALTFAGVLGGLATMLVLGWNRIDTPESARPSAAVSNNVATRPADPIIETAPAPTWVGARRATWARDGSRTISFELQAGDDVPVWMTRLRPVLVVRCLSRQTEVFVVTGSTSIERKGDSHTVRIQFDDGAEMVQEWSGSVSSQELFAPDGVALARRLARARTMRFGFTPYNASPVVARFHVGGFDQLVGLVATTCGWRADHPRAQENRQPRSSTQTASS